MSPPVPKEFWKKLVRLIGKRRTKQWQQILCRHGALPAASQSKQPNRLPSRQKQSAEADKPSRSPVKPSIALMPLPDRVSGINRKDALALARQLGCSVASVRRTGEIRVTCPATGRFITLNGRRKDASRKLSSFVNRLLNQARCSNPPHQGGL